jgi:hypothetical protein
MRSGHFELLYRWLGLDSSITSFGSHMQDVAALRQALLLGELVRPL